MGHECKCGQHFTRKNNFKKHLSRNTETCLKRYTDEELQRDYRYSSNSILSPPQGPAIPEDSAPRGLEPPFITPPPHPASPSASSPDSSPRQAHKRARTSPGSASSGGDDSGGWGQDGFYFSDEEQQSTDEQGPRTPIAADTSQGRASPAEKSPERVLLYDVLRSQRVSELLECFEDKAPYKPIEVRLLLGRQLGDRALPALLAHRSSAPGLGSS